MLIRSALFLFLVYSSVVMSNDFKFTVWCEPVNPDSKFYDGLNISLTRFSESILEKQSRLNRDVEPMPTYQYAKRLLHEAMRAEGMNDFYYEWELEQMTLFLLNMYLIVHLDANYSISNFNSDVPRVVNWFKSEISRCRRIAQERSRVREIERQERNALFAATIVSSLALSILRDVGNSNSNRDRSKDVCYQLPSGSDAQTACLGDHPMSVRNERARNILLGHCYSLGSGGNNSNLSHVCSVGARGCSILGGDAGYWCQQCGGTRRWLAVYSLGHTMQCLN